MRRAVVALLLLAGALVAPASSAAAFPEATFENQCQYSYDQYWRPVPLVFGGRLTNGSSAELTPGAQLQVGDTVRLENGTVSALLPSWITTFAYESSMIPEGDGSLPVTAWLALEATNTAEGITAPIKLTTVARTHVELTPAGLVDESRSSIWVEDASIPAQSWQATGGQITVRQATGESLAPIPARPDGTTIRPRGSLYVDAALTFPSGDLFHLYLDCLQGQQVDDGAIHTDALPGAIATFAVPGYDATVDGAPLTGPVDADLLTLAGPARAAAGAQAVARANVLRVRLTDAQRDVLLPGATTADVAGTLTLTGARSVEQTQTVDLDESPTFAADGAVTLTVPVPDTTWTAATGDGVDITGSREIALEMTAGAVTRRLVLTRTSPVLYPFTRILRPGANPTPITRNPPPVVTPVPTVIPQPTPTPKPAPKPGRAGVASKSLKVKSNRVSASVSCTGETTCRGTVKLRSAVKVKKRFVTLTKSVKYTAGAGKKVTVRLRLSSAGKKYLRGKKKRVSVVLDVKPASGKTVSKRLTLSR